MIQSIRVIAWLVLILPRLVMGLDSSVPTYPSGILEVTEQGFQQNHPVMTDLMKKVNGVVTSDGAQWLKGQLNRQLYRVSPGQNSESAYQFYVDAFTKLGVSQRFSCQSFSCGASNYWANDVFDIARLYGLDRYQFYFIGEKEGQYFSVYTVKRGNGRTYALVDVFTPEVHPSGAGATQIGTGAEDWFLPWPFEGSDKVTQLVNALQSQSSLSAIVQIQSPLPSTVQQLDRQEALLMQQREQLQNILRHNGVKGVRIHWAFIEPSGDSNIRRSEHSVWLRIFAFR